MEKILNINLPKDHYKADIAAVWCFDNRFWALFLEFIKNTEHFDPVLVAGGAKDLASPARDEDRAYVLGQIEKSIRLHHTSKIALMAHAECGAYGRKFSSEEEEKEFYAEELQKAESALREFLRNPKIKIIKLYASFDGLFKI